MFFKDCNVIDLLDLHLIGIGSHLTGDIKNKLTRQDTDFLSLYAHTKSFRNALD